VVEPPRDLTYCCSRAMRAAPCHDERAVLRTPNHLRHVPALRGSQLGPRAARSRHGRSRSAPPPQTKHLAAHRGRRLSSMGPKMLPCAPLRENGAVFVCRYWSGCRRRYHSARYPVVPKPTTRRRRPMRSGSDPCWCKASAP